ncbi:MAG: DUF2807 domain-containing protein [Saprospiraceae bacterium]|nr:DUF2807 domain-containing protein [Saprospiraceae bacterium]
MKLSTLLQPMLLGFCLLTFQMITAQTDYSVDPFENLSVMGNIDVNLEKGTPGKVTLYAEGIPEDDIDIRVSRGTLRLKVLNSWLYKNEIIKVYVPYETIRNIRANAGAKVSSNQVIQTETMDIHAGSGAKIDLEIAVESLECNASEGSQLTLWGETTSQRVSAGTGGQVFNYDLASKRTYARSGTGGQIEVVAIEFLEASANTGGRIIYKGEPEEKRIKTIIGGDVEAY